jgi:hypothetical protein
LVFLKKFFRSDLEVLKIKLLNKLKSFKILVKLSINTYKQKQKIFPQNLIKSWDVTTEFFFEEPT